MSAMSTSSMIAAKGSAPMKTSYSDIDGSSMVALMTKQEMPKGYSGRSMPDRI